MDTSNPITSAKNPQVKQLRKLASSQSARRQAGVTLAHGTHLVRSCIDSTQTPQHCVYATSSATNPEVAELLETLDPNIPRLQLSDELYESISDVHAHVGISLICDTPTRKPSSPLSASAILLDRVQDPGNLGTILRTAAASGIREAYLSPGCASAWSPKTMRAGMGAQFALTIYEDVDLEQLVDTSAIQSCVTTLSSRSASLYEVSLVEPTAWIFGSEGQGVSETLQQRATHHVRIPQTDSPVESLNVAAAAAVCMYEQLRQSSAV